MLPGFRLVCGYFGADAAQAALARTHRLRPPVSKRAALGSELGMSPLGRRLAEPRGHYVAFDTWRRVREHEAPSVLET